MNKLGYIILSAVIFAISACATPENKLTKTISYANDPEQISLQNLDTRVVVNCYTNEDISAQDCSRYYESQGFVRFREIPQKPADFDKLKVDTYPTRRWRDSEITSRW